MPNIPTIAYPFFFKILIWQDQPIWKSCLSRFSFKHKKPKKLLSPHYFFVLTFQVFYFISFLLYLFIFLLYQKKTPKQKSKNLLKTIISSLPPLTLAIVYPFCPPILANTLPPIFSSTSTSVSQTSPYFIIFPTSFLFVLKIPKKCKEKKSLEL
jgi:hypothetical protein